MTPARQPPKKPDSNVPDMFDTYPGEYGYTSAPAPEPDDEQILKSSMAPVNREKLIEWVSTFQAQNEQDKLGVLDFKNALLWRLKDENLFPVVTPTNSMWHPDFVLNRRDWLQKHDAQVAKAERERVFVALRKEISDRFHLKPRPYDPNDQEIPQIGIDELAEIFDAAEESLRQPEPQQEIPSSRKE